MVDCARQRQRWSAALVGARRDRQVILEGSMGRQYAIGWGTLALINAGLAQGKGRSGLAWFLASLLLGPIATLLIVLLDPVPVAAGPRTA